MKATIVLSREADGAIKFEYAGKDGEQARVAAKKASDAGRESFVYFNPLHGKRYAATVKPTSKK